MFLNTLRKQIEVEDIYPTSRLQMGMLIEASKSPELGIYHDVFLYKISLELNEEHLLNIWQRLIRKHPLLRTSYIPDEQYGYLAVQWQEISLDKHYKRLESLDEKIFIEHEKQNQFILQEPGLFRLFSFRTGNKEFTLIFSFFHVIADGWSVASLMAEFIQAYSNNSQIMEEKLPQYPQFVAKELAAIKDIKYRHFWKNFLSGLECGFDHLLLKKNEPLGGEQIVVSKEIDDSLGMLILILAKKLAISPDTIFLGLYFLVLSRFYATYDLAIGIIVNNRLEEIGGDKVLGLHLNTMPLRIRIKPEDYIQLEKFISKVAQEKVETEKYKIFPYSEIKRLIMHEDHSNQHIYIAAFNYTHFHILESAYQNRLMSNSYGFERTSLPIAMSITRLKNTFSCTIKGNRSFLKQETATEILNYLEHYLYHLVKGINKNNPFLLPSDYQRMIYDWNKTRSDYPRERGIPQLFEEQVNCTPNNIAAAFEGRQLTYRELNQEANQLARFIRKKYLKKTGNALKPDTLIVLCIERSLELIVGILGVLKAGGAYVPIEPSYPKARIDYILEDTQTQLILEDILFIDKPYQNESKKNLPSFNGPDDLAYVIYTSGTTGNPKGVMIEHRGVVRLVKQTNYIEINDEDSVAFSSSPAFDAATFEIWGALLNGACLIVMPQKVLLDFEKLEIFLAHHTITILSLIASLFHAIVAKTPHIFKHLKYFIVGGEKVSPIALYQLYTCQLGRPKNIIQAYGPTESTTFAATYLIEAMFANNQNLPIGKPISNTTIYVLDAYHMPLPIGVIGELYIGGDGLARGYLNQPELTAERFIANPFSEGRLYKTGDLVRWLPDGNLEYIGRNDFQVKIRGYRIELGEIEQVIESHPKVQQCVVVAHENKLISYYTGEANINFDEHLSKLPEYMIPSQIIQLMSLPLTPHGKLDRKALPLPDFTIAQPCYVAPQNEIESLVCDIWGKALDIDKIGIEDDFFKLGGHSILAIQVAHRMSRLLKHQVLITDIFTYRTVAKICKIVCGNKELEPINVIQTKQAVLSYAQERLWFIEQYEGGINAYHIPIIIRMEEGLLEALQQVIHRHEILRTRFLCDEKGCYLQEVHEEPLIVEKNIEPHEFIHRIFDLTKGHALRAGTYNNYLVIVFHHIAFDGWSEGIFRREIKAYLNKKPLPALEIQYKDFAVWQRNQIEAKLEELMNYWKTKLANISPLNMPTDYPRPVRFDYKGRALSFELPYELQTFSNNADVTTYTTLLTGLALTLSRYAGQSDLVIGTAVANRQHPQLAPLIGFFVNTLVLRLQLNPTHTIAQCMRQIQDDILEAQRYQNMPFEKIVDELQLEKDSSRHPIFQVMFVVQYEDEIIEPHDISVTSEATAFDLIISLYITPSQIKGAIRYAVSLYKPETIERFIKHYQVLLETMLAQPKTPIGRYSILSKEEYQRIIYDWNKTEKDYPKDKTIHQLFEEQVKKTPNNIAVIFAEQQLTYKELNEEANQLARYIQKQLHTSSLQVRAKQSSQPLVALCMDRSLEMVIAILGILKAGAAYVPIDPSYPKERIDYIIEDTKAKLVLDNTLFINKPYQNESKKNLTSLGEPHDLAYVIYTSGTTGKPKGVMVEHQAFLFYQYSFNALAPNIMNTAFTLSYCFDASLPTLFGGLLTGGKVFITDSFLENTIQEYFALLKANDINTARFIPSMLNGLLDELCSYPNDLTIVLGGERYQPHKVAQTLKNQKIKLFNQYGPTECVVGSTVAQLIPGTEIQNLGKPYPGKRVYVLDEAFNPVPIGCIGELYIGGAGLARGYLNQPELTAERFIANPFSGGRLYKTGDLVRWLPDGNLEYIGRNDFQVKIRGYRIELGEIEQVLNTHKRIHTSAVQYYADKPASLVAYYVPIKNQSKELQWWPTIAEYYIYDEFLYSVMALHETRNEHYRQAIRKVVRDKIVVDVGTGPFVILAKICIEEGAKHVYALEYLEKTYLKAKEYIKQANLEDKITLIWGDSRQINLPEKCDVCVSEILGAIAGAEGIAVIIGDAKRRHVKPGGVFIPELCITQIAAVTVPEEAIQKPLMTPTAYQYIKNTFDDVGYEFDLRLSIKGIAAEDLISNIDAFETLSWQINAKENDLALCHEICLQIEKNAKMQGFLVWLNIFFGEDNQLNTLYDQGSWLPIFVPAFPQGIEVNKGDLIRAKVSRCLASNALNFDYEMIGELHTSEQIIPFQYQLPHVQTGFKENYFYEQIFEVYHHYDSYSLDNLETFLLARLPSYMVPKTFIEMVSFPLTSHSKLDRKALPIPDLMLEPQCYVAPGTRTELMIAKVWQEVLALEKISTQDDFFRLGGDSILSIQVSARLQRAGLTIRVKDIFTYRTIERLSKILEETKPLHAEQGLLTGRFKLLPIQQWFFTQRFKYPNHWNQSFLVRVPKLSVARLQSILIKLIEYHDVLHLQFTDRGQQSYIPDFIIPEIKTLDVSVHSLTEIQETLTAWQSNFNIEQGILWQVGYLYGYTDNSARLYIAAHHLIMDGVSLRILIDDLKRLYEGGSLGQKSSSYRQWVNAISDYPKHNKKELIYWQQIESDDAQKKRGRTCYVAECILDEAITNHLLGIAHIAYHTQINDLLLTALAYTLNDWLGKESHSITLEGHGREPFDENLDVSRTMGWFTTHYPVQLKVKTRLDESIKYIKENLRQIPYNGVGFSTFKTLKIKLPDIIFNYLGQFDNNSTEWQIVNESSGQSIHPENKKVFLLNINGLVIHHRLQFKFESYTTQACVSKLAKNFKMHLKKIIAHCISQERSYYTPSDFDTVKLSRALLDKLQEKDPEIEAIYPANSLQQGFIYHALSQPEDDAYRVQLLLDYHQSIHVETYEKAWELAIQTYPILRTYFNWQEELIQIITKKAKLHLKFHDISAKSSQNKLIQIIQQEDRKKPFDLQRPTLLRLYLIKNNSRQYTLLQSMHHSILDGWSGPILLNQVHQYYQALMQGVTPAILQDTAYLQTQDYIAIHKSQAKTYWEQQLRDVEQANDLNPLLTKPCNLHHIRKVALPKKDSIQLHVPRAFLQEHGLTLHVLTQFTWHKLIHVYTQDEKTIVGTTVSGRSIPVSGIESSVGLYINTLPLVLNWHNEQSILEQLKQIESTALAMNEYSFTPLSNLQKKGPLFHSILIFENYPLESISNNKETGETNLKINFRDSIEKLEYPLGIIAYEKENDLIIKLQYDGTYLAEDKAQRLLAQFKLIFEQIFLKYNQSHHTINLLTPKEYQRIIYDWNKTEKAYPKDKTIHQLFEEQVEKTPNNIAVIFADQQLTYKELNARANQLARYIRRQLPTSSLPLKSSLRVRAKQSSDQPLIAVCMDRSLEMIIAILGILKAGAAYVPIEPSYPKTRRDYILKDTQANLLLDNSLKEKPYKNESTSNLPTEAKILDLAYVIYTSGTTGNPKGVRINHQGIYNFIMSQRVYFEVSQQSNVLQFAQIIFDVSVCEIFTALLAGAKLIIIDEQSRLNNRALNKFISQEEITIAFLTPAVLKMLIPQKVPTLKTLIIGGEICSNSVFKQWRKGRLVINAYGPTENTICTTMHIYQLGDKNTNIGKPLFNTEIYILDSKKNPLPSGVVGELYISGEGLSLGYLNQSKLTAEKFIENPFAAEKNKQSRYTHLYRTGDLARWLEDGSIEYIGRNDSQIKVRGHRIELTEIEQVITSHPDIQQCVVLLYCKKKDLQYLIAYFTSEKLLSEAVLKDYLLQKIPKHMIPNQFIQMKLFPLTLNGKIDRKALPPPHFISQDTYVAPRNKIELTLAKVWQGVLGLPKIGINDDFFHLGGDSILSIQVSARLQSEGINCSTYSLFEYRSIKRLAKVLHIKSNKKKIDAEQEILIGEFDLLPIQSWFFEQKFPKPHHWNQAFLLKTPEIAIEKLEMILTTLIKHHDILRLRFIKRSSERISQIYQISQIRSLKSLNVSLLNKNEIKKVLDSWQNDFDIYKGPLWRMGYLYGYSDNTARIYFAFHHLIIDTVSWRILIDDIKRLYFGEPLLAKTSSYRQWVKAVKDYSDTNQQETEFWRNEFKECPDYQIYYSSIKPQRLSLHLNQRLTQQIFEVGGAYNIETIDLLLSSLAYTLKAWQGSSVQVIGIEGHGREEICEHIDVSRTLGWFTTISPLRLEVKDSMAETIKHNIKHRRNIPYKGIGYSALTSNQKTAFPKHDLLVQFNYLGIFDNYQENWFVTQENSGLCIHSNNLKNLPLIMINCYVYERKFKFNFMFKLDRATSLKFKTDFDFNLKMIIKHCEKCVTDNQFNYNSYDLLKFIPYELICQKLKEDPIFMFPAVRSGAECYYNIVKTLKSNKRLVLFNNYYDEFIKQLGPHAVPNITYKELAHYYISHIKNIQKTGPYTLFGWSFGGVLAFEVARQLSIQGEKVSKIILIDPYFNYKKWSDELGLKNIRTDDINYLYSPQQINLSETKIILFKATIMEEIENVHNDIKKLFTYYTHKLPDNDLSSICKANITVIPIKSTHEGWVTNKSILSIISKTILQKDFISLFDRGTTEINK